ncbi:MAG: hypothetical protein HY658_10470, partial [Actinobacteria bacterium]|nr:hypothetical protein [Actinomycetota bacterium]
MKALYRSALALILTGFMVFPLGVGRVSAQTVTTITVGALDGNFPGPRVTELKGKEGGNTNAADRMRSGNMTRINDTTYVTLSPGADRIWGTTDDGAIHCFGVGTGSEGCEFITLGALQPEESGDFAAVGVDLDGNGTTDLVVLDGSIQDRDDSRRAPMQVNINTAIVLGAGEVIYADSTAEFIDATEALGDATHRAVYCEDASSHFGSSSRPADFEAIADDVLHIIRGLGASGATVESHSGFCFGAPAADPIRVNRDTLLFVQPGDDVEFHDSDACTAAGGQPALDDQIVVVRGLFTASTATVTTLNVGAFSLGKFLSGAPAGRPVRVSNSEVVVASPGADGEFADHGSSPDSGFCGSTSVTATAEDDGLIVVRGLEEGGGTPALSFITLGPMGANPHNRPVAVNEDPGTVVVLGTGTGSGTAGPHERCDPDPAGDFDPVTGLPVADDQVHVVQGIKAGGTLSKKTFAEGLFCEMHQPVTLRDSRAVVFNHFPFEDIVDCCD